MLMILIVSVGTKTALLVVGAVSRNMVLGMQGLHDAAIGFLPSGQGLGARLHTNAGYES